MDTFGRHKDDTMYLLLHFVKSTIANFDTKFAGFEIVVCFHMKILSNAFYGFSLLSYIISFGEVVPPSVNLTSNVKMERKYHHDFKDLEVFCCLSWCWIELTWHVYACTLLCLIIMVGCINSLAGHLLNDCV